MQCLLPVRMTNDGFQVYFKNNFVYLDIINFEFIDEYFNEVIIYDTDVDGSYDKFNYSILEKIPLNTQK